MATTPGTPGMDYVGPVGLYLSDVGGDRKVYFVGANAPYPIPQPKAEYAVTLYSMRRNSDGPGYRAAQIDGSAVGFQDYELSILNLSVAQKEELDYKFYRPGGAPQPMELSFDDGKTKYLVVWQKDGWEVSSWEENWRRYSGKIKLHVLAKL